MKKRNWLKAVIVGFAAVAAVTPTVIKASSPNAIGYYSASDCTHFRDCPGGLTFCGYSKSDCTGIVLNRP